MQTEIVYMGIFSSIFNAIFNAILAPVFKFISGLLEKVLGWLFNTILQPLLVNVFYPLFESLLEMILEIFGRILYGVLAQFLQIIDAIQEAFNIFSGLKTVTYQKNHTYTMLELVFRLDGVQRAVLVITAIAVVLTLMFAILATVRSTLDIESDNKRTVSRVLTSTMNALIKMALIPIVSLFAIMMAGQILNGINYAMGGSNTTLSRMLFVVSSLDAAQDSQYNISSSNPVRDLGINDAKRKPYYTGAKDYANIDQVGKDFKFGKFDYLIGFAGCLFLLVVLAMGIITFISRIFEVILLFIAAPFFASTMPLDDGEKFRGWQDMFVGKLFGGYGIVMSMQLYMMLVPAVMNGDISFGDGSTEANYLIRIIFLLGGAWATLKSGPMITQLISAGAGQAEAENAALAKGVVLGGAALIGSGAMALAGGVVNKYRGRQAAKLSTLQASDKRIQKRMNLGTKPGGGAASGVSGSSGTGAAALAVGGGAGAAGRAGGAGGSAARPGAGTGAVKPAGAGTGAARPGAGAGTARTTRPRSNSLPARPGAAAGSAGLSDASSGTSGAVGAGASGSGVAGASEGGSYAPAPAPRRSSAGQVGQFFGGRFTMNTTESGRKYLGINFGKALNIGRDEKGNFRVSVLGIGYRESADGQKKVSLPFVNLKSGIDSEGNAGWSVSKVRMPAVGFKRAETVTTNADGTTTHTFGNMYCSNVSPISLQRRFDQDTGNVETLSVIGRHYGKNEAGQYVRTHSDFLGVRTEFQYDDRGRRSRARVTTHSGRELYSSNADKVGEDNS